MQTDAVIFSDTFDEGRKPDWTVVSGAWVDAGGMLQATAIEGGEYFKSNEYLNSRGRRPPPPAFGVDLTGVSGPVVTLGDDPADRSMIVVSGLSLADCTVDIDSSPFIPSPQGTITPWPTSGKPVWTGTGAFNHAVLRYLDEKNYILAGYHPGDGGALFIFEVVDDSFNRRAFKTKSHFYKAGPLHLTASVTGTTVKATVTDANGNCDSVQGELATLLGPGLVGLFHDDGPGGLPPISNYDNFVVSCPGESTTSFSDRFPRGVFLMNEQDALVTKKRIDDLDEVRAYYDRAMSQLAVHGFNLALPLWAPADHRLLILDSAHFQGLKVIAHLPEIATLIRSSGEVNVFNYAERLTRGLRDHAALAGYYIVDELLDQPGVMARARTAKLALEVADATHPILGRVTGETDHDEALQLAGYQLMLSAYPIVHDWTGDLSDLVTKLEEAQAKAGGRFGWRLRSSASPITLRGQPPNRFGLRYGSLWLSEPGDWCTSCINRRAAFKARVSKAWWVMS